MREHVLEKRDTQSTATRQSVKRRVILQVRQVPSVAPQVARCRILNDGGSSVTLLLLRFHFDFVLALRQFV